MNMKMIVLIFLASLGIITFVHIGFSISTYRTNERIAIVEKAYYTGVEAAYFHGQKDYAEGKIKIEQIDDCKWKWKGKVSPVDNERPLTF